MKELVDMHCLDNLMQDIMDNTVDLGAWDEPLVAPNQRKRKQVVVDRVSYSRNTPPPKQKKVVASKVLFDEEADRGD